MVKEILKKLFYKDHQSSPPSLIRRKFKKIYPHSINEEWLEDDDLWEVVFHDDQKEKIARFNLAGKLVEGRINTSQSELPAIILKLVIEKGELMNAILIDKAGITSWEIIYRDKHLNRYLMVLDQNGQEISCSQL